MQPLQCDASAQEAHDAQAGHSDTPDSLTGGASAPLEMSCQPAASALPQFDALQDFLDRKMGEQLTGEQPRCRQMLFRMGQPTDDLFLGLSSELTDPTVLRELAQQKKAVDEKALKQAEAALEKDIPLKVEKSKEPNLQLFDVAEDARISQDALEQLFQGVMPRFASDVNASLADYSASYFEPFAAQVNAYFGVSTLDSRHQTMFELLLLQGAYQRYLKEARQKMMAAVTPSTDSTQHPLKEMTPATVDQQEEQERADRVLAPHPLEHQRIKPEVLTVPNDYSHLRPRSARLTERKQKALLLTEDRAYNKKIADRDNKPVAIEPEPEILFFEREKDIVDIQRYESECNKNMACIPDLEVLPANAVSEMLPAPAVDEVLPAPSVDEVLPAPSVDEVLPAPSVDEVLPAPSVDEVLPAPSVDEVLPAPSVDEVLPAPSVDEVLPAPVVDEAQRAVALAQKRRALKSHEECERLPKKPRMSSDSGCEISPNNSVVDDRATANVASPPNSKPSRPLEASAGPRGVSACAAEQRLKLVAVRRNLKGRPKLEYTSEFVAGMSAESRFVLGSNANIAMGYTVARGRIYRMHSEMFKYMLSAEDLPLVEGLPQFGHNGARPYICLLDDLERMSKFEMYKDLPSPLAVDSFQLPALLVERMKVDMLKLLPPADAN